MENSKEFELELDPNPLESKKSNNTYQKLASDTFKVPARKPNNSSSFEHQSRKKPKVLGSFNSEEQKSGYSQTGLEGKVIAKSVTLEKSSINKDDKAEFQDKSVSEQSKANPLNDLHVPDFNQVDTLLIAKKWNPPATPQAKKIVRSSHVAIEHAGTVQQKTAAGNYKCSFKNQFVVNDTIKLQLGSNSVSLKVTQALQPGLSYIAHDENHYQYKLIASANENPFSPNYKAHQDHQQHYYDVNPEERAKYFHEFSKYAELLIQSGEGDKLDAKLQELMAQQSTAKPSTKY